MPGITHRQAIISLIEMCPSLIDGQDDTISADSIVAYTKDRLRHLDPDSIKELKIIAKGQRLLDENSLANISHEEDFDESVKDD